MSPGSVIVDLAAERGGNCELTKADERTIQFGVVILGPTNLPSEVPYHASPMFSKNIATLLLHLVKEGQIDLDMQDEINKDTTVALGGEVVNNRIRELLGMEPMRDESRDEAAQTDAGIGEAATTSDTNGGG